MNLRKIIFTCLFLIIMLLPINAFAESEVKPINLSTWQQINELYSIEDGEEVPNWVFNSTKTSVTGKEIDGKSGPSVILLSDIQCENKSINGTFSVDTEEDDDFIGFVFGYQDTGHFYLFDWRQYSQGYAKQGMSVKCVNSSNSFTDSDFWDSIEYGNIKIIYQNNIGYRDYAKYQFSLNFTDRGVFNIIVKDGNTILDNITINDSTYTSGKFGLYSRSQNMVVFQDITLSEELPLLLAANSGNLGISLNWDDTNKATSYNIKRSEKAGGPYTTITTTSAISFTDTTVVKDTTYYYVVSAINDSGEESNSNEVVATAKILDPTLEVTSVDRAKAGEIITANVVIHNAINICAEDIKIAFDNSKLQFINAEGADGIKIYKEDDSADGVRRYITASLGKTNAANGDKILIKLKFKAIATGDALIDITKGRIADNATLEMDVDDVNCGEKTIIIEGPNDVNRSGKYTLLDLGIDAWYYGDLVSNTDTSKFETDQVINDKIDDDDLAYIVDQMLNNVDYPESNTK